MKAVLDALRYSFLLKQFAKKPHILGSFNFSNNLLASACQILEFPEEKIFGGENYLAKFMGQEGKMKLKSTTFLHPPLFLTPFRAPPPSCASPKSSHSLFSVIAAHSEQCGVEKEVQLLPGSSYRS
jgi:hypothetical protein